MIYRTYGHTGVQVSALGFGGMRFADQNNVEDCSQLIKSAYDAGFTYFDTAPGYGKSEELFGVAFKEMKKTRAQRPFYVATKTMRAKPDEVRKELEQSLRSMGLDYIDFYHVWCVMSLHGYQRRKSEGVLAAFEKLQQEGLIRHICVSSHMTGEDVATMLADYPFAGVLLGYSAMNFSYREKALQAAARTHAGVVVMNPLGGGLIPRHPELFSFLKTREEETVVQAGLRFLLNDPRISVALVGLSSQQQLAEAVSAVNGFAPIDDSRVEAMKNNLKQSFTELCTGCGYCDNCPEGIPVPRLMDAYNHYMLNGGEKALLDRLAWHWSIGKNDDVLRKCTQCRLCEESCTQHLPVTERIEKIRQIAEK